MVLEKIYRRRRRRLALLAELERVARSASGAESDRLYANVAIELHNLWVQYARSIFVASCRGAWTGSGTWVCAPECKGMSSEQIIALGALYAGRVQKRLPKVSWSKEPKWFDLSDVYACFDGARLGNIGSVDLVQGASLSVFKELNLLRNFAAHRSAGLAERLRSRWGYLGNGVREISEVMGRSDRVYPTVGRRWIVEMTDACDLLSH